MIEPRRANRFGLPALISKTEFGKRVLALAFGSQLGLLLSIFALSSEGHVLLVAGGPLLPLFSGIHDDSFWGLCLLAGPLLYGVYACSIAYPPAFLAHWQAALIVAAIHAASVFAAYWM